MQRARPREVRGVRGRSTRDRRDRRRQDARHLTHPNPRERLIEDYIYDLTGSSLQSAEQVQNVAGALGIEDSGVRRSINDLRGLFVARNEISRELDFQQPEKQGDRARRTRKIADTEHMCHGAFEVAQQMVDAVATLLSAR